MHYFAYGANLSRAHMQLWCPSSRPLVAATLPNHRLVFRCRADIVASEGFRPARLRQGGAPLRRGEARPEEKEKAYCDDIVNFKY